ncbi:ferrochelatase [Zymomonas mobilis]|uniref:Ferrochelatase n=1 Tax=Zymomonas mobilis subsp. pomaceae (strain ATCC 29192 / DSM 22645 / JCM 10191 / CCUG 17912 / NBRC 13757 / NCIMB 11200 / NRRL B-4491 / Barker I) TaxID=579138 RepID=F8ESK8_ZYMMT|nr:ferrochelatase [Zymomonas mobilis]AEI37783.1 ferrochelatase [Zymomonas mobilis subsp. pomaceae ATCC 29192]MDX5949150.1 ferrochelatase [Zymomonas mobilis subsp. pomaceae]GEB89786.1 ferrochelatase [Zymomonas mobilis subsp. pomaceae]
MNKIDVLSDNPKKIGVLLVNLGTPTAPTAKALRRYLGQFLSDRRVIEIPPLLWQPILRGIILPFRAPKSAHAYASIWTEKGSPLAVITQNQAHILQQRTPNSIIVEYAMRYGAPSIKDQINHLIEQGCRHLLLAPLYPQYSAASTATVQDEAYRSLQKMRWQPIFRSLAPYYNHPDYINALKASIETQLEALDFVPEALLLSYHGMPVKTREQGDPYYDQCIATSAALSKVLNLKVITSFQSRFGTQKWFSPATATILKDFPAQGIKKLVVAMPGFSADCLETLEEIAIRGQQNFIESGGENFATLQCLNDSEEGITMLESLIKQALSGWIKE